MNRLFVPQFDVWSHRHDNDHISFHYRLARDYYAAIEDEVARWPGPWAQRVPELQPTVLRGTAEWKR